MSTSRIMKSQKKKVKPIETVKCIQCKLALNLFMTPDWVVIACPNCNQAAGKISMKFFIDELEKSKKLDEGKREEF